MISFKKQGQSNCRNSTQKAQNQFDWMTLKIKARYVEVGLICQEVNKYYKSDTWLAKVEYTILYMCRSRTGILCSVRFSFLFFR